MGSEVKVKNRPYKILHINDLCGVGGDINYWGGIGWGEVFGEGGRRWELWVVVGGIFTICCGPLTRRIPRVEVGVKIGRWKRRGIG